MHSMTKHKLHQVDYTPNPFRTINMRAADLERLDSVQAAIRHIEA